MTSLRRLSSAVTVASLLLASMPATAYFSHFLQGTILGTLSRDQTNAFIRTFKGALSQAPDNEATPFQFPADKNHGAIDGTLRVLHTRTDHGQRCRQMRTEVNRGSQKERWTGWWCKQANGDWKKQQTASK